MGYFCKDHCKVAYKARAALGNPANKLGWAKCSVCSIRLDWEGKYCPCCGAPLSRRTKVTPLARCRR